MTLELMQTPGAPEDYENLGDRKAAIFRAAKDIAILAIPNTLIFMMTNVNDMVSLIFISRTGNADYISAVGVGNTIIGMVALQPLYAISVSVDTLVAQCFGKGDYRMCGQNFNKAMALLLMAFIPALLCLFNTASILRVFGFDEEVAGLVGAYTSRMYVYVFSAVVFYMTNRFLNAQQIINPQMMIIFATSALHPVWCYIFIFALGKGYLGLNYAYSLTNLGNLVGVIVYIVISGCCKGTLCKPDSDLLKGWKEYLNIACASVFMAVLEWWGYYIVMLFAGCLDVVSIATNQVIGSVDILFYMVPAGVGSALTAIVGSKLGDRKPQEAKLYAFVATAMNVSLIGIMVLFFLMFRRSVSEFYTTNVDIQNLYVKAMLVALVSFFVDCTQGILSRIFVAQGKQMYATITNLIMYYGFLVPLGYACVNWFGMGIYGLWFACATSFSIIVGIFGFILARQDWDKLAAEAYMRNSVENEYAAKDSKTELMDM